LPKGLKETGLKETRESWLRKGARGRKPMQGRLDDVFPPLRLAESTKVSAQASAQELVPAGEVSQKFS